MTEEPDQPENLVLRALREMRAENAGRDEKMNARFDKIEGRLDGLEGRAAHHDKLFGKLIDAVTAVAKVQEQHSSILADMHSVQKMAGGRLNIIDGRLGAIEKRVGLADA